MTKINVDALNDNITYQITALELFVSAGILDKEEYHKAKSMLIAIRAINNDVSGRHKYVEIDGVSVVAHN